MKKETIEILTKKAVFEIIGNGCFVRVRDKEKTGKNEKTGKLNYPTVRVGKRILKLHRYAYELEFGEVPEGFILRHKCDNPLCFNTDHLEIGTRADNARDMISRKRWKGKNSLKELTEEQKIVAKVLLKEKDPYEVARLMKLPPSSIFKLQE